MIAAHLGSSRWPHSALYPFLVFAFLPTTACAFPQADARQAVAVTKTLQQTSMPRPTIGLALEGGGALGFAHVGVLRWFFEHRIPVDRIAGTSMGAVVGSLFASGYTPDEIDKLASSGTFEGMFAVRQSLENLSFRRREDRDAMPHAVTIGLRGGTVSLSAGLIDDTRLNAFLTRVLLPYNAEDLRFDELPIPFRCVATDLTTLRPMVFASGSLPSAVRASISIPGVFEPVHDGKDLLVDGAIVDNLPTDLVRNDLHADIVFAIHLADGSFGEKDATSPAAIFARALQAGTSRNEEISRKLADVEILPDVHGFTSTDYDKASALEQAGYAAAEKQRVKLLAYALTEEDWALYRAAVLARRRSSPGRITQVRVEGPEASGSAGLARQVNKLAQQPFNASQTEVLLAEVRSDGALDASYETFRTSGQANPDDVSKESPDSGILFHWRRSAEGPPYLLLGADVLAMTSNVTRTIFDLRFVDQDLVDPGSELRVDASLGYLTRVNAELFQPFHERRFFLQPRALVLRQPVYLWQNQQAVSQRLLERAGGGFDLGMSPSHDLQIAFAYNASTLRWRIQEGTDNSSTPYLSGITQSVAAHLTYSNRTAEIASPRGTRLDFTAGRLLHTTESPDAPFLILSADRMFSLAQRNLLSFAGEADTYFHNNVPDPLRFTLGGPLRLYASSLDGYRGTDALLGRITYLRRVATLPTGLGQGVYLVGGLEAGTVWSPEQREILRQDGFSGVLLSTPLGAITLGGAIGDAGRRKMFFTFGKLF